MGVKAALPKYELCIYMAVLSMAIIWAGCWVFEVSSVNINRKAFKATVKPGWHYFGRKMDIADFEWVMWFSKFRSNILFALSGHVIFAKICSMLAPQHRSIMYMAYGLIAISTSMGWTYVALILSHCILLYSISLVKVKWLCFVTGFINLATFKVEPFISWQGGFVKGTFELQHILFYGGCGFTIMRCMSFALENCDKKESNYSFLELLKYNFYLPFFYFGPVMTFDKFHTQVNNPDLTRKDWEMWNITTQAIVHLGAIIVVDILLHFLYILTMPNDIKLLKRQSDWALAGLAYSNLVFDWVKSAVMFGVINTVARLDHLEPPRRPKCATLLYVFAETHFDRGINDWLCKYVYNYLGGNHDNIWNEFVASVSTFAITTLWLGPCEVAFIWSFLNCFGLNFELWLAKFFSLEPFASMEMTMSEAMSRRIRAIFNAAYFWTIVMYNIVALNSIDFAKLVARRLLIRGFPVSTLSLLFVTYCGVQLIKEQERRQALLLDPDPSPATSPPTVDPAPVTHIDPTLIREEPGKEKAE